MIDSVLAEKNMFSRYLLDLIPCSRPSDICWWWLPVEYFYPYPVGDTDRRRWITPGRHDPTPTYKIPPTRILQNHIWAVVKIDWNIEVILGIITDMTVKPETVPGIQRSQIWHSDFESRVCIQCRKMDLAPNYFCTVFRTAACGIRCS